MLVENNLMLQALLGICVLAVGGIIGWLVSRQAKGEDRQTKAEIAGAEVEVRVSVVEAKVEYLENGRRVRFDLTLDKALLQEQIQEELARQGKIAAPKP